MHEADGEGFNRDMHIQGLSQSLLDGGPQGAAAEQRQQWGSLMERQSEKGVGWSQRELPHTCVTLGDSLQVRKMQV